MQWQNVLKNRLFWALRRKERAKVGENEVYWRIYCCCPIPSFYNYISGQSMNNTPKQLCHWKEHLAARVEGNNREIFGRIFYWISQTILWNSFVNFMMVCCNYSNYVNDWKRLVKCNHTKPLQITTLAMEMSFIWKPEGEDFPASYKSHIFYCGLKNALFIPS